MSKLRFGAVVAIALVSAMGACGGKVVVDGSGNVGVGGGIGGTGGVGGGIGGTGGTGQLCYSNLPDASELTFCGGSTGTGGSNTQCANQWCDLEGNTYTAICEATTCQCWFNGGVACTCALNGPGNFCVGTPTCCPLPGSLE